jgi:dipeptidase E
MSIVRTQIIAMGGGGFSMEPENLLLDRYVLAQAHTPDPVVCFVPTASGDSDNYIRRFYDAFSSLHCRSRHLSLFRVPTDDLMSWILECDVIYVGGGNSRNLMVLWREHGLDVILRAALERGCVLAGLSAGANCWFEQAVSDSWRSVTAAGRAAVGKYLGFLPGSFCPHYDGEKLRRPEYHRLMREGQISEGWAADDGCALHFVDGVLHATVSSRINARSYRLSVVAGNVQEAVYEPQYLGAL